MIPPPISPLSDYTEKRVPGGTFEHESWELYTQSAIRGKDGDVDDDFADIQESHHRQIKHYKNLLIRAQSASAASIHELHTKLTDLEGRYGELVRDHSACETSAADQSERCRRRQVKLDLSDVKGMMGNLGKEERLDVLATVLEGCYPSDVSTQIAILQKYKRSRFDVLCSLPGVIATAVLKHLDLSNIMQLRQRIYDLTKASEVWRYRCLQLDGPIRPARPDLSGIPDMGDNDRDWEGHYRRLHVREINWRRATPTAVTVVSAHTKYITSLCLHQDTLISGSYDENIRIWHLPPLQPTTPAQLILSHTIPAKAVSCLAYHPPTKTMVAGYHDNGRIQIWREIGLEWVPQHVLHAHLHGIRGVAINHKWAVSAGADKTIVVWDLRTGEKSVKFGQQMNICLGLHLIGDIVITMTVDGTIRTFSIARREMVAQYKLWDIVKRREGKGADGMISWFDAEGLDMACGTKDGIYRFRWQTRMTSEPKSIITPSPAILSPNTSSTSTRTPTAYVGGKQSVLNSPMTASPLRTRTTLRAPSATPTRVKTVPIPPPPSASSNAVSSMTPIKTTPRRSMIAVGNSPTPSRNPRNTPGRKPSLLALNAENAKSVSSFRIAPSVDKAELEAAPNLVIPDVTAAPIFAGMIAVKDMEKGAIGPNDRIVGSTRFAARQGAQRELYVGSYSGDQSKGMTKMGGAWGAEDQDRSLRTPEKNPLSIVMDREKVVYGCADGSLVIVGFM